MPYFVKLVNSEGKVESKVKTEELDYAEMIDNLRRWCPGLKRLPPGAKIEIIWEDAQKERGGRCENQKDQDVQ